MFSKTNKTKKSFIGAIAMALVLLMASALTLTLQARLIHMPDHVASAGTNWKNYTLKPNGAGNYESPYLINSEENLAWLIDNMRTGDTYIRLETDLDLSAHEWTPIRVSALSLQAQVHVCFEGNNHTIFNLKINSLSESGGLFDMFDARYYSSLDLANLNFEDVDIFATEAGTVGAYICGGTISNVNINSGNLVGKTKAAGLYTMGWGLIRNCRNNAKIVSHWDAAGGLVAYGGYFEDCINTGDIYGGGDYLDGVEGTQGQIGGIAGFSTSVIRCFNYGNIFVTSGTPVVGGIVARGCAASCGFMGSITIISGAYSVGSILAVWSKDWHISNSFGIADIYFDSAGAASAVKAYGSDDSGMVNCYSYSKVSVYNSSSYEYRKIVTTGKDAFNENFVYDEGINGGFPFLHDMFAVGQFIDSDAYSYLISKGFTH